MTAVKCYMCKRIVGSENTRTIFHNSLPVECCIKHPGVEAEAKRSAEEAVRFLGWLAGGGTRHG